MYSCNLFYICFIEFTEDNIILVMANTIYKEHQRYEDKLVLAILSGFIGLVLIKFFTLLLSPSIDYTKIAITLGVALALGGIVWWLSNLRMKLKISDKGIKVKMPPIQKQKIFIPWSQVAGCDIVESPAAAQWSGSNITYTGETQVSLCGRNGLSIKTKKGRKFFIGCKDIPKLQKAMEKLDLD